jgi:hypothetical protein
MTKKLEADRKFLRNPNFNEIKGLGTIFLSLD